MNPLVKVLKFLVVAGGNLIADVVQIEAAVPTVVATLGAIAAVNPGTTPVGKVAGAIAAGAGSFALALPKIISAGKSAESELTQLLDHVEGTTPKPAPPPPLG